MILIGLILIIGCTSDKSIVDDDINSLEGCRVYYDGCNQCEVLENGDIACTEMACEMYGTPKCMDEQYPKS